MSAPAPDRQSERGVLLTISLGLIVILLSIIAGIFITPRTLPNWAENVLVSIGTAAALKLGDCLATLVALSTGKSVERLGAQLGVAGPAPAPMPADAADAADQTAAAAQRRADEIGAAQ